MYTVQYIIIVNTIIIEKNTRLKVKVELINLYIVYLKCETWVCLWEKGKQDTILKVKVELITRPYIIKEVNIIANDRSVFRKE